MREDTLGGMYEYSWPATAEVAATAGQGVYFFHGLGEHGMRYSRLAAWFNERGYKVAAHDHPGHGHSPGRPGALFNETVAAKRAVLHFERFAATCSEPPLLVAHSMGGALAANLVLSGRLVPGGLILSAPAFEPALSYFQSLQLQMMNMLAPDLVVKARLSGPRLTHDKAVAEEWARDDLICRSVSARLISWLIKTGDQALAMAPQLAVRTLMLIPEADEIVRPEACHRFAEQAPDAFLTTRSYPGLYHEIFNESAPDRDRVLADVDAWLRVTQTAPVGMI